MYWFKKTFDIVNHSVVIEKLNHYGIRGVAENWIKSYLFGIKQCFHIGECSSDLKRSRNWALRIYARATNI